MSSYYNYTARLIRGGIEKLAASIQEGKHVHIHLCAQGESKTFCGTKKSSVYHVVIPAQWRGGREPWMFRIDSDAILGLPTSFKERKYRKRSVTLCKKCQSSSVEVRERLLASSREQIREKKQAPELTSMDAPQRQPGTEDMTGHLDEGSAAGGCGEAASGFKTKFLPWINCATCLVYLDWMLENDLVTVDGYYVKLSKGLAP